MTARRPWLIVVLVSAVLFLSLACGRGGSDTGASADRDQAEERQIPMVNRIAYIDNTGDLLVINPDSTGERRLTGDVRAGLLSQALQRGDSYSWPTWSRDGTKLAASRVSVSGESAGLSVQVFDLDSGGMRAAYTNSLQAPVADGTPHYLYWSPDDRLLSFLAPTPEGLTLFVRDSQGDGDARPVSAGAPLYYHWAADSGRLAVHSGDRVTVENVAGPGEGTRIAVDSIAFRAPAVSPDGTKVAYAGFGAGVHGIFLASMQSDGGSPTLLVETQGLSAFAWSPDGSVLAVAEQLRRGTPVFDRLRLISPDGSETSMLLEEQLLAFFWSPQGDRIAWVGIDPLSRSMDLAVSPVEGGKPAGEPRHLFSFSPTGELFTMFSFFDQYAYSHSIWSPDGSALVVTGTDGLSRAGGTAAVLTAGRYTWLTP